MPTQQQEVDPRKKARYWLLTIKESSWVPNLPNGLDYVKGQLEEGGTTGYRHWQLIAYFKKPVRLNQVKQTFTADTHCEPSRSDAVEEYVWKEETRVGEQFEFGEKSFKRNSKEDWHEIKEIIKTTGDVRAVIEKYPDTGIRYVNQLLKVAELFRVPPVDMDYPCGIWIWGPPGVGKSRYVRDNYGHSLFCKEPTEWWTSYRREKYVLMDDLDDTVLNKNTKWTTGAYDLKIWGDQYVFEAQYKGIGTVKIRPERFIVTSNYPIQTLIHEATAREAIERRFYVIYMPQRRF